MIEVTYLCPKCEQPVRTSLPAGTESLVCPACQFHVGVPPDSVKSDRLDCCVVCAGGELYVRKNFPQQLGVAIVVVAFAISIVTWYFYWIYLTYAVLFAAAAIDAILYLFVGNMLQCYRCQSQYRGVPGLEQHSPFNLETHERYRQQAARLSQNVPSLPKN